MTLLPDGIDRAVYRLALSMTRAQDIAGTLRVGDIEITPCWLGTVSRLPMKSSVGQAFPMHGHAIEII
ncbi:hypothetical protein [Nocardia sp. NPDC051981]|uniref:hypothetical protein n=1 Tax=Nocardia sp. NPDC051981 TaxID=3155417 RepID=UPI003421FC27